jgi:hypothetical protein
MNPEAEAIDVGDVDENDMLDQMEDMADES